MAAGSVLGPAAPRPLLETAVPRTPLDRLPKLARTVTCVVVTDSEKADAYEQALLAHQAVESELANSCLLYTSPSPRD